MGRTYIYLLDTFRELGISFEELADKFEKDRSGLEELIRSLVEKDLERIKNIELYSSYFNPESLTAVIEYMVESDIGRVSVKVIHADSPARGLQEYYKAEDRNKVKYY